MRWHTIRYKWQRRRLLRYVRALMSTERWRRPGELCQSKEGIVEAPREGYVTGSRKVCATPQIANIGTYVLDVPEEVMAGTTASRSFDIPMPTVVTLITMTLTNI